MNPYMADTDKDKIKDNVDYYDNTYVYVDYEKHKLKHYNMLANNKSNSYLSDLVKNRIER